MTFELWGKKYRLDFQYYEIPNTSEDDTRPLRRKSVARLLENNALLTDALPNWCCIAMASAVCGHGDNFNRAEGRLRAFRRLLVKLADIAGSPQWPLNLGAFHLFRAKLQRVFYTSCRLPKNYRECV